jgi:hypothetical protein
VTVTGSGGRDLFQIEVVGTGTTTLLRGGADPDTFEVHGKQVPFGAVLDIEGNDPIFTPSPLDADDRLLFDPQDTTPLTSNFVLHASSTLPAAEFGDVQVKLDPIDYGLVTFDTVDFIVAIPPIVTFTSIPSTFEGKNAPNGVAVRIDVSINTLGNPLDGPLLFDLNGDGLFGEFTSPDLTNQSGTVTTFLELTWAQLADLGINDGAWPGGTDYQIAARATTRLDASTTFSGSTLGTLHVNDGAADLTLAGPATARVDEAHTITFSAFDFGDDRTVTWAIDWKDATGVQTLGSTSQQASHVYRTPGSYLIDVTATDEDGRAVTESIGVTVGVGRNQVRAGGP